MPARWRARFVLRIITKIRKLSPHVFPVPEECSLKGKKDQNCVMTVEVSTWVSFLQNCWVGIRIVVESSSPDYHKKTFYLTPGKASSPTKTWRPILGVEAAQAPSFHRSNATYLEEKVASELLRFDLADPYIIFQRAQNWENHSKDLKIVPWLVEGMFAHWHAVRGTLSMQRQKPHLFVVLVLRGDGME